MFPIGMVLTIIAFGLILLVSHYHASVDFVPVLIAFAYMCLLIPFSMVISPTVKKNLLDLNQPSSYIYAKVGLLIFVISNVIELVV